MGFYNDSSISSFPSLHDTDCSSIVHVNDVIKKLKLVQICQTHLFPFFSRILFESMRSRNIYYAIDE